MSAGSSMQRFVIGLLMVVMAVSQAFAGKSGLSCKAFAGEFVRLRTVSGRSFDVYQTGPRAAALGVLLMPGRRGLSRSILAWADRLGVQGYRVMAVGLSRSRASVRLRIGTMGAQSVADTEDRAALYFLRAPGRKIVALGWGSAAAHQALVASAVDPADVAGTVLFDGGTSASVRLLSQVKSLILLVAFNSTPLANVQSFEGRARIAGRPLSVHYYNASAQMAAPMGPNFNSGIAQDIWAQTQAFFEQVESLCRRCAPYPNYLFDYHD